MAAAAGPIATRIRSFVMRAGRMTAGQEQGWQQGFPQFGLTVAQGALDWDKTFGSPGRRVLEIGFGMGDSLLQMAEAEPETQFVGIEVHRPGVGRLLSQALGLGIGNLRVYAEDAVDVLSHCVGARFPRCCSYFLPRSLAQKATPQAPFDSTEIRWRFGSPDERRWVPSSCDRLDTLCGAYV